MFSLSTLFVLAPLFASQATALPAGILSARQNNGDPQQSLTLDPKCVGAFSNNGQDVPAAGQVPSLTSTNNYINLCLTAPNVPLTNGKQITTGSYNPAPIGFIPSVDHMPSAKFVSPKNLETVKANTAFTISLQIKNLGTGNFVNAQENYFSAPQQLDGSGVVLGHSHVVIEKLDAIDTTTATDPKTFAFFKGLNGVAQGGVLNTDVTAGLPEGVYRLATINTAANHQPVVVPVAQHGSLDDIIYFVVTADGQPAAGGNNNGAQAGNGGNGAGAANGNGDNGAGATKGNGDQGAAKGNGGKGDGAAKGNGKGKGKGQKPADGQAAAPAPADGQTPKPVDGQAPPPADGQTPAPAAGQTPPPADGQTSPPAAGAGQAPPPAADQTPAPAAGQAPAPADGQTPAPAAGQTPPTAAGQTPPPADGQTPPPAAAAADQAPAPAGDQTPAPADGQAAKVDN